MTVCVAVTGATGWIGRPTVEALAARGAKVIAVSRSGKIPNGADAAIACDILNIQDHSRICEFGADVLVHLAWEVTPGYWTSPANEAWRDASIKLVRSFAASGGRRAILAGTCAEYNWSPEATAAPVYEDSEFFAPFTPYGQAKLSMRRTLEKWSEGHPGFSVASGLIFMAFGGQEAETRFVPTVVKGLLSGNSVALSSGEQIRDFIDIWSIGDVFAALALSETVIGPVNVARGTALSLRELALALEARVKEVANADCIGSLQFGALEDRKGEPKNLIGNPTRLIRDLGYTPPESLEIAIERTVEYWRNYISRI